MRKSIGVGEFRAKASRILRRVHETLESVDVTYRGEVIARIVPVVQPQDPAQVGGAVWTDLNRLAGEIGRHSKPQDGKAADEVSEERKDHEGR